MNKICIHCGENKNIDSFSKNWKYYKNICKGCVNVYSKSFYKENRDIYQASHNKYYIDNKEKVLNRNKEYHIKNPHISKNKKAKRRMRIENWDDGTITKEFLDNLLKIQNNKCVYCSCDMVDKQLDHIIPISKWGSHTSVNVQWTCSHCNLSKWAKTNEEFIKYKLLRWNKNKKN